MVAAIESKRDAIAAPPHPFSSELLSRALCSLRSPSPRL